MGEADHITVRLRKERTIQSKIVTNLLDLGYRRPFAEHLCDRIAGNQANQAEHQRHNEPDDRNPQRKAADQKTEHAQRVYGLKRFSDRDIKALAFNVIAESVFLLTQPIDD